MATDLSDRYNEGIVPPPPLPTRFPNLRSPTHRPTPEESLAARAQLGVALMSLGFLLLLLFFLCLGFYWLVF
jgi:hypothetical protein